MNGQEISYLITKRFFLVLDVLKMQRKIRGLHTFTRRYNLNYWNVSEVRKNPQSHCVKMEWLSFLVSDYNVSAEYLLCGTDKMFKDSPTIWPPKTP